MLSLVNEYLDKFSNTCCEFPTSFSIYYDGSDFNLTQVTRFNYDSIKDYGSLIRLINVILKQKHLNVSKSQLLDLILLEIKKESNNAKKENSKKGSSKKACA